MGEEILISHAIEIICDFFPSCPFPPLYVVSSSLGQALVSSCPDYRLAWLLKVCAS